MRHVFLGTALLGAVACSHTPATMATPAMSSSGTGAFVVRLGSDTVAVERFSRTGNTITDDQVIRAPATTLRHWTMTLGADGRAQTFTLDAHRANGSVPATHADMTFGSDTVVVHVTSPRDTTLRVAARDAFPYVGMSYAALEPMMMRARMSGAASYSAIVLPAGAAQGLVVPISFLGADSATFSLGSPDRYRARVDSRGRILGLDGSATTQKFVVSRVADVDVAAAAAAWSTAALGVHPPTDSVDAAAAGANLRVVYSRPSLRGRQLMGYLIPYGSIWRTGANAATMFTTSAPLMFGDAMVPAGTYTLWTLATPQGAQLVINKQTGQWGTVYNQDRDLARIPMTVERLTTPVEQFTLAIDNGCLSLAWDDTRAWVPITVAP